MLETEIGDVTIRRRIDIVVLSQSELLLVARRLDAAIWTVGSMAVLQ